MKTPSRLASLAAFVVTMACAPAAEAVLKPGDVVACVGGEDMAAAAEYGYIESLVTRALPGHRLKFRSVAWEGDTAFEQARELNYPPLEQQLDEMGATIVLVQFGQMESLAGESKRTEFARAYEKLIERLGPPGKRTLVLLGPTPPRPGSAAAARFAALNRYTDIIREIAARRALPALLPAEGLGFTAADYRDDIHLNESGHQVLAARVAQLLAGTQPGLALTTGEESRLLAAIREKNRLWFRYSRPQNWAFLNGDRTVQPSSRDHLDPSKRWFPEEMKQWLPIIAAQEEEIHRIALGPGAK